jgi:hypothetical protein
MFAETSRNQHLELKEVFALVGFGYSRDLREVATVVRVLRDEDGLVTNQIPLGCRFSPALEASQR